jgi:hypothetical protein
MDLADAKIREVRMDHEDFSSLATRIEGPKAVAVVFLRACRHSDDIDQPNRSKFSDFSGYMDQRAGFVRTTNLSNEGN